MFTRGSETFSLSVTYSTHTDTETEVKRWYDIDPTVFWLFFIFLFFAERVTVKISETAAASVAPATCEHGHRNEMQDVTANRHLGEYTSDLLLQYSSQVNGEEVPAVRLMSCRLQTLGSVSISYPGDRMSMSQVKCFLLGLI